MPQRDILIAVDDSEGGRKAFDFALREIARPNSDDVLHLAHAVKPEVIPFVMEASMMTPVVLEAVRQDHMRLVDSSKKFLGDLAKQANDKGIKTEIHVLDGGDARDVLVEFANGMKPAMFVLGSRGLGVVKRTVLGSVSTYATHNCECPVVVVR